jgi:DNA ligase-associated metallophosphoesterase
MNSVDFTFRDDTLTAMASGALWWQSQSLLCVSDLHMGKSERIARRSGTQLPPYETRDTLARLTDDLEYTRARTVICLGDSFDDPGASLALRDEDRMTIARLQSGRQWIWIEGNHDPGPVDMGGTHQAELSLRPLTFRHIAIPGSQNEISGHYHPKARIEARGRSISRPAFLVDAKRVIMPAYGTYTGGLETTAPVLTGLMRKDAHAILTGKTVLTIPMPR